MDKTTRKSYQKEYDTYSKAAERWLTARNDIMNMDVSTIKAKDIKQRYKNARKTAGGSYIY